MSIKIIYNSSSLKFLLGIFLWRYLLFKLVLDSVDVDALANHQNVFCEGCIINEDRPCCRDECASKLRSNQVNNWKVKHHNTCWVCRQVWGKYFLRENEEAKSVSVKCIVLNVRECVIFLRRKILKVIKLLS